ncbi:EF-hand domain-containing protein [Diaphorobacter sp. ED-3]|uniref:EF-hand domain-containing protein n=1 Tax=Diaphorobacter sp. ED-3 TaxID=3016636 RepID=UPI0022DD4611|nr:EF-hand domain-containing protein [Diaphorobacter sp. ED-3]
MLPSRSFRPFTRLLTAPTACAWLMACALTAPLAAQAQGVAHATAPRHSASAPLTKGEIKAIRQFEMLDFNGDGKLSRAEVAIVPKVAAAFDDADTNRDNYVTLDEVRAFAIKYRAERDGARAAAR